MTMREKRKVMEKNDSKNRIETSLSKALTKEWTLLVDDDDEKKTILPSGI